MSKRKHNEAEIVRALKHLEAGRAVADVAREIGVSKHAIYAWKAKYGGLEVSELQRLRQLEDENRRLKKLVEDLILDKEMLKAVIAENGWSAQAAGKQRAGWANNFARSSGGPAG